MKWHYDKKFKQWWTEDTDAYACNGFTIKNYTNRYRLEQGHFKVIGHFNKLSSAKTVAELLMNG